MSTITEELLPVGGWRSRLTSRLAVAFILPTAIVGLLAGGVAIVELRKALRDSALERLLAATSVREAQFDRWVAEQEGDLRFLATVPHMQASIETLEARRDRASEAALDEVLRRAVESQRDFTDIVVLAAADGRILAASDAALVGRSRAAEPHFAGGLTGVVVQNVHTATESGRPTLTVAMPVRNAAGRVIAVLAGDANLARVEAMVAERSGLGETGEAYLVDREHRTVRGDGYDHTRSPTGLRSLAIDRALRGEAGAGIYTNYAGREVVGVYRWIPARELAIVAEMSSAEAFAPADRLVIQVLAFGLIAMLTLGLGLMYVARQIARPVLQIAEAAGAVARGDLHATAPVRTRDEIGQLAAAFNTMTGRLRHAHAALEAHVDAIEDAARDTEAGRRLLRTVVDHLPAIVAVKDLQGRYMLTNTAFGDFHGIPAESLIGRSLVDTMPPAVAATVARADARVLGTRETVSSEEVRTVHGVERTYLTARFPLIDGAGEVFAIGVVATDITERKRLERQILHQQKLEAVGRLAGGVAHDMNNLLTAVRCNAELLLDGMNADDPDRQPLEEIDRSVRNGSALTRQLLTFSRAHVVRPSALDVNRILGGMAAMLRRYVGTGIDMRFDLAADLWLVRADEGQMEQVLLNLLSNAHDAMPLGGSATVSTTNVVVGGPAGAAIAGLAPGDYVRLAVADTGTGIDPDVIPLLFEPFFTTKDAGRGTGLGLSTAHAIVQQALGAITVESVVGRGTTFSVYLPRHAEEPLAAPGTSAPAASNGAGGTVLVVDDEPSVRGVLRRVLEQHGYDVLEAHSGTEALHLFDAHQADVGLALTDVFMPEMSGHELATRLRARRPDFPVVFMSGYTASEVTRRGIVHDETRFLQKPFNKARLVGLLDALLHPAVPASP